MQLAALMHDAHEAYTGDVSSPVKWAVGPDWALFEAKHDKLVARALGMWRWVYRRNAGALRGKVEPPRTPPREQ